MVGDIVAFARLGGRELRAYQQEPARAIARAARRPRGDAFAVMFPRQSGKNELQAQLEAYLLYLLREQDAELVKISPTWKPQSLNAMRRLERVLAAHPLTGPLWAKESGYIYRVGRARIFFLSGAPEANIVGATATHLLAVDEAQDVRIDKFDRDVAPMAASSNAARVFWGTAWTAQTLLARELRAAQASERQPGTAGRRAFVLTADEVAREVPAYGAFVAGQVARLGRSHPMVRTQYFSEELDGQAGMFPAERQALMHAGWLEPAAGFLPAGLLPAAGPHPHALLLDVAGEDETGGLQASALANPRRDSTALTVVAVDRSTLADALLRAPTYRVVERRAWVGVRHARLYGEIRALAERWRARWLVVDATGVGAGLASFLERALPGRVLPFTFNAASKSRLGWEFLALVDAGRWQEPPPGALSVEQERLQAEFFQQLRHCQYAVLPGPARAMRWGVPDGTRDAESGAFVHDDLVISAALSALLDGLDWGAASGGSAGIVRARDPLEEMRGF